MKTFTIELDDMTLWRLARYREAKADLARAGNDRDTARFREEVRSYAVEILRMIAPQLQLRAGETQAE
jgi:hypothetical protein